MIKNDLKLNKHYLHEKSNNIYELLLLTNINLENKNFIPTAVYKDIKTNYPCEKFRWGALEEKEE